MMLGKRRGHGTHELNYRPHNVTHIVMGTVFLWVDYRMPLQPLRDPSGRLRGRCHLVCSRLPTGAQVVHRRLLLGCCRRARFHYPWLG